MKIVNLIQLSFLRKTWKGSESFLFTLNTRKWKFYRDCGNYWEGEKNLENLSSEWWSDIADKSEETNDFEGIFETQKFMKLPGDYSLLFFLRLILNNGDDWHFSWFILRNKLHNEIFYANFSSLFWMPKKIWNYLQINFISLGLIYDAIQK